MVTFGTFLFTKSVTIGKVIMEELGEAIEKSCTPPVTVAPLPRSCCTFDNTAGQRVLAADFLASLTAVFIYPVQLMYQPR